MNAALIAGVAGGVGSGKDGKVLFILLPVEDLPACRCAGTVGTPCRRAAIPPRSI